MAKKKKLRAFAANLKSWRMQRGLTQKQLAEKIDLKLCNINAYEQDRSRPKMEVMIRIARFFKKDINEMI